MEDYRRSRLEERQKLQRRKKSRQKSMIIFVETVIIIVLTIALVVLGIKYKSLSANGDNHVTADNSSVSSVDKPDSSAVSSGYTDEQLAMIAETEQWYLKLVNPDNPVDNDFINGVELAKINERFSSGHESSMYFDKRAVEYLNSMCQAALNDNVHLIAVSSYRSYSYQNTLYNNRVKRFVNQGYSEADAKATAATIVALPGTSEHHMGLAVDINEVEETFENTSAFKWLQEHAEEYGFVMRYAKDKQDITKIIYEPWHYRYVGIEHAKAMNELGMCLEEYVDYLKSGGIK